MYSMPSKTLLEQVLKEPRETAMKMKSLLLENYDAIEALEGKMISGGTINAFKAVRSALEEFGDQIEGYCTIDSLEESSFFLDKLIIGEETIASGDNKGYRPRSEERRVGKGCRTWTWASD